MASDEIGYMFRRVSFDEAARYSPWPQRIAARRRWKTDRSVEAVHEEYQARYRELLEVWRRHKDGFCGSNAAQLAHSFLAKFDELNWRQIRRHPEVYGDVDPERTLVSFQDELYVGPAAVAEAFFRQLVVQAVLRAMRREAFDSVVEIGCGTGYNLINIACQVGVACVGCDLSEHAVAFVNTVADETAIGISGRVLNYLEGGLSALAPTRRWALLSVHALEQAPDINVEWVERIVRDQQPPTLGIHLEPLHLDGGPFADLCSVYSEINSYNRNLSRSLAEAEQRGLIDVVERFPRVIGSTAFNPTSVLVWRPRPL